MKQSHNQTLIKTLFDMQKFVQVIFGILIFLTGLFLVKSVEAYTYPIYELGNCRDFRECHLYCEIPVNKAACWSYSVYGVKDVLGDETAETKVAELGVTFPIAQLGNCTTLAACKNFCNISTNQTTCAAFAQSHGLANKESVVTKAQTELGCATKEDCKEFCAKEENRDACTSFAKKYHLKTVAVNPTLEAAKTELGCATIDACRAFCAKEENRTKCSEFGKKNGKGGARKEELVGRAKQELGCTSFEDCRAFCQDKTNADKCRNFGSSIRTKPLEQTGVVGDCKTAAECKKACTDHPEKCPTFPKLNNSSGSGSLNSGRGSLNSGPGSLNSGRKLNELNDETEVETETEKSPPPIFNSF